MAKKRKPKRRKSGRGCRADELATRVGALEVEVEKLGMEIMVLKPKMPDRSDRSDVVGRLVRLKRESRGDPIEREV